MPFFSHPSAAVLTTAQPAPLYRMLASHYRQAAQSGSLKVGERMPALREIARRHRVSVTTALQMCRMLEDEQWLEARPRAGYFVRLPERTGLAPVSDPPMLRQPDPAQYVGINAKVSEFLALGRLQRYKTNLSVARCAPALYPADALRQLAKRYLHLNPDCLVKASSPKGNAQFRSMLAKRALAAGMQLSPGNIQITNGCTEALNLALRAVANPGDTIAVESPTFYGLLQTLEALGLKALEIPTSPATGISVDAVELALRSYVGIKAVVVVPFLQNPTGSIMPDAHKERLLALCQSHDMALIEDDTYSDLVNEDLGKGLSMRAIKSWDSTGHVIHCASLHKSLSPGLRLGWISAGRWQQRVEMLKFANTRSNEDLAQAVAAAFIGSPAYDRHLRRLRVLLRQQRAQTAQAITRFFPAGTCMTVPQGGLSLWVALPPACSATDLFHAALKEHIVIAPGTVFSNSSRFDTMLRINCGWPLTPEIEKAFASLGRAAHALCGDVAAGYPG